MAQYTGTALLVKFKGTTVSTRYRSFKTKEEIDMPDQSAGTDVNKTYLTALKDGDGKLEVLDVAGGTAATDLYNLCVPGAEGTLEWAPEGTATGKPRHYVNAISKTREKDFPFDDVVQTNIEFKFSGVVTNTAY